MVKAVIITSVLLFVALLVIVGLVAGIIPWQSELSPTTPPPTTSTPQPTAPTSPTTQNGTVKFEFAITEISGDGLSRTITARITNAGTADAHNVWAKVEAFSADSRVRLSGQDYIRVDIGTLKANETTTRRADLSSSIIDGLRISNNGVRFVLTLNSDEHTQTFSYDYQP